MRYSWPYVHHVDDWQNVGLGRGQVEPFEGRFGDAIGARRTRLARTRLARTRRTRLTTGPASRPVFSPLVLVFRPAA